MSKDKATHKGKKAGCLRKTKARQQCDHMWELRSSSEDKTE